MICYSFFAFFIFMHLHFKLFARRFYATFRSCVAALVNLKNSSLARAGAGWEGRRSVGARGQTTALAVTALTTAAGLVGRGGCANQ
jgi:hypothetical protein